MKNKLFAAMFAVLLINVCIVFCSSFCLTVRAYTNLAAESASTQSTNDIAKEVADETTNEASGETVNEATSNNDATPYPITVVAPPKSATDVFFEFIGPTFGTFLGVVSGGIINRRKKAKEQKEIEENVQTITNKLDQELDDIKKELISALPEAHHIYHTPIWDKAVSESLLYRMDNQKLEYFISRYKEISIARTIEELWMGSEAGNSAWSEALQDKAIKMRRTLLSSINTNNGENGNGK